MKLRKGMRVRVSKLSEWHQSWMDGPKGEGRVFSAKTRGEEWERHVVVEFPSVSVDDTGSLWNCDGILPGDTGMFVERNRLLKPRRRK